MLRPLFLLTLLSLLITVTPRTAKDDFEQLERGDSRVLLGTILGNTEMIKLGIHEGGSVHAVLEPFIADIVLQKSPAHKYLPVCPSVHLAIFMGHKEHLNCASFLLKVGADMSQYELPAGALSISDSLFANPQESANDTQFLNRIAPRGFPPAVLYAFGFGRPPTSSHAELILRLYKTLPSKFNVTRLQQYFNVTGNPPLLHITAMNDFRDGTDLIIHHRLYLTDHLDPINEPDSSGATVLHLAAWNNNIELMIQLLTNHANISAVDHYGRTALHYAAMRGHALAASLLVDSLLAEATTRSEMKTVLRRQARLVSHRDLSGRDALQLAGLSPPSKSVVEALTVHHKNLGIPVKELTASEEKLPIRQKNDFCRPSVSAGEEVVGWNLTCSTDLGKNYQLRCIEDEESSCIADQTGWTPSVDAVAASDFTSDQFRRNYFTTQKPVLITGQLTRGSTIWAHWTKEHFLERYGTIGLQLVEDSTPEEWQLKKPFKSSLATKGERFSLSAFANTWGSVGSSSSIEGTGMAYSSTASWFVPALKHSDLPPPPLLRLCAVSNPYSVEKENRHYPYSLALGQAGSFLPSHSLNASWSLLLFGWAEHYLVSPGDRVAVEEVLYNITTVGSEASRGPIAVNNTRRWLEVVAPELLVRGLAHRVQQSAGDVLFVPHNWVRVTVFHSEACLITQEVCSAHHTIHRYTPLGGIIYGGVDKFRAVGGEFNTYQELTKLELSKVVKNTKRSKFPIFEMPPVT